MWSAFASSRSTCTSAGHGHSDWLMSRGKIASATQLTQHPDPKRSALSCVVVEGSWRVPIEVFFEIRPAQQTYEIAKPLVRAL